MAEINLEAKTWTVPKERMKGAREHRVPLSAQTVALLRALPREGPYVFIGARAGRPLSPMAMMMVLKRAGHSFTVHGFRSAFRDWAAETTGHANIVVEAALAHAIGNAVEASYRRGDLFEKRARLMADWATYCDCVRPPTAAVVPIRRLRGDLTAPPWEFRSQRDRKLFKAWMNERLDESYEPTADDIAREDTDGE